MARDGLRHRLAVALARVPAAALALTLLGGCQLVFQRDDRGATSDGPMGDSGLSCPANYEQLSLGSGTSGFYRFVVADNDHTSWRLAEADCKKDGPTSHLVVLGSSASATAELNVVFERVLALEGTQLADALIGMSARLGQYKWVTDEPLPIPSAGPPVWAANEPVSPDTQPCVEIDVQTGTLVTVGCDVFDAYVCECDAFPEQPANF